MDIGTRTIPPTSDPAIKVSIVFDEKPHTKEERAAIATEVTKVMGQFSRRERAKVQVDMEYGKTDMELFREALDAKEKAVKEELAEFNKILKNADTMHELSGLAVQRDQKLAWLQAFSYVRLMLPR